uniref:Ubiquitin-like protease family profile domain-containing protein n=1 Tax=Cyprinus carpio TaxID=7962 RepID=A0A8C1VBH6_CYPCA
MQIAIKSQKQISQNQTLFRSYALLHPILLLLKISLDILALQDPKLVISKAFKLCITQGDLATLKEGCWLNDKVIDFYLSLLMKRNRNHGEVHAAVKNWTKTQDVFLFDLLFVPLHLGMHWALAVIDFKSQTIQCYDSMGQRHDDICHITSQICTRSRKDAIPKWVNGNDCGVFVCKYADFLSQGKPLTFRPCDIPLFRKVMIWEIIPQKIL